MQYISTRGQSAALDFEAAMLAGLAPDGGLYMPDTWPQFDPGQLRAMAGLSYEETAWHVLRPFMGGMLGDAALRALLADAWRSFDHPDRTPLTPLGSDTWLLELHHGPTLAFKDLAMQFLARIMDAALERRDATATVLGATSGDTGSAALQAFAGRPRITAFAFFPEGRISEVQRRQMTTLEAPNVHAVAVRGSFDDIQALVKGMFNDRAWRGRMRLAAVNSINWARILAQAVYYFFAALRCGAPDREVAFTVPTGNFGDAFAGYAAMRMGLPISRILVATNSNDIVHRIISRGRGTVATVIPTHSPSMDIQVPSNFERALFDACGRDPARVRTALEQFAATGVLVLEPGERHILAQRFTSGYASEEDTTATIARIGQEHGILVDPHTAVGLHVAAAHPQDAPMVVLATAHPAKFPEAVAQAAGRPPVMPPPLAGVMGGAERVDTIDAELAAAQSLVERRVGA